jgi:hypothetical protein
MSGRHQPEEGADSPRANAEQNGGGEDPPMVELPRASRDMVEAYVRQHMPNATVQEVASQVSETLMADGLGRAYHASRWPGGIIDTTRCMRVTKAGQTEDIPYGYDDERPDGYACDCEKVAIHLIEVMKAQQTKHDLLASSRIVRAERPLN